MKIKTINKKLLGLLAVLIPLLLLFFYVALRSGPLASVPVTVATVETKQIIPVLSGIGTIEARHAYQIGAVTAGRVRQINVDVGDVVAAGQVMGEMDPVDLDERLAAQNAVVQRAEAAIVSAEALIREARAKKGFAAAQDNRYRLLQQARAVSVETLEAKHQEAEVAAGALAAAKAGVRAAKEELASAMAEYRGMVKQRHNLLLVAPVDGLVTSRNAEPGNTVSGGQTIIEMINPESLWIDVRFDQLQTAGLKAGLFAQMTIRSQPGRVFSGSVLRVELLADRITEETLAKIVFNVLPVPLPPVGELCEVAVQLPPLPAKPVVPNASIHRVDGRLGVWVVDGSKLRFVAVRTGAADRDGFMQVLEGLKVGTRVVVYSKSDLHAGSRIRIVSNKRNGTAL
ncbi:efflux RND transporter periplasmic adaptor subunit [Chlorobium phaeobacteroides]|uniref:Efflux transporter, RND family, MFP subunit n=1 Tax=Chlorobium phaeobacteroides (strain DSM 266 / SMG 266 / 2430) TaxID=290317 RepID=A1BFU7_CHLPD|nr:efflux RND transporter periplasmic adaptor subunit [Chlorobium phaeobacteroides]ABL65274.1 efflux transporter, RND family, MFP subunit [Chlorobium phaeobacteroides DSM 266]